MYHTVAYNTGQNRLPQAPWNKGKLCGQKRPLKLQEIWAIRIRLEMAEKSQDLALFNLAIDSKLRACDLMGLRVTDVAQGGRVQSRARVVKRWVCSIGLDPALYGTHSMRRTKAALIYRRTKNIRAIQLLLGHTKLESTVRHLGIDVDDALELAEQTEV
ncbi:MAG: integrase [Halioglobus sp.]